MGRGTIGIASCRRQSSLATMADIKRPRLGEPGTATAPSAPKRARVSPFITGRRPRDAMAPLPIGNVVPTCATRVEVEFLDAIYAGAVTATAHSDPRDFSVMFDADGEAATLRSGKHRYQCLFGEDAPAVSASPPCGAAPNAPQEELDREGAITAAVHWYDEEAPRKFGFQPGLYRMKTPVVAAYRNSATAWSLKYVTEPPLGQEFFLRITFRKAGPGRDGPWEAVDGSLDTASVKGDSDAEASVSDAATGWETAERLHPVPATGLFVGRLTLAAARVPSASAVSLPQLLGCAYSGACTYFARNGSAVPDSALLGVAPQMPAAQSGTHQLLSTKRKKKKKMRKAVVASSFAAPPPDGIAVAVAGHGHGHDIKLHVALAKLVARGLIGVEYSDAEPSTAAPTDLLHIRASIYLLPSVLQRPAAADVGPESGSVADRNSDMTVLIGALLSASPPSSADAHSLKGFSVHSFYDTLWRPVHEWAASCPTPSGMTCALRPYQERAHAWMRFREGVVASTVTAGAAAAASTVRLPHPLWTQLPIPKDLAAFPPTGYETQETSRSVWVNLALGKVSRVAAWCQPPSLGGILAEEMGLGKTVEVIAITLSHPIPPAEAMVAQNVDQVLAQSLGGSAPERSLKATLIIAPHSILQQWRNELQRHAPGLVVEVYAGLHEATSTDESGLVRLENLFKMSGNEDFAAAERREEERRKRLLAMSKADVVLTTYQVLRKEVHYASDFSGQGARTLRHAKRYAVPTCPLLACRWWRVVLDEAQMVEGTTTATAKMALQIRARHRWCVTGTPVGARGVYDLHGLLLFLRHEPFCNSFWWKHALLATLNVSAGHGLKMLSASIKPLMWRSSKKHVKAELNVPPMEQRVIKLELSQGEREVYDRIQENIATRLAGNNAATSKVATEGEGELMQLRLACAHPQLTRFWLSLQAEGQVVGGDGGGISLSMKEILERMMTMAQQDMERHERELCKHLTHLSLVFSKRGEATAMGTTGESTVGGTASASAGAGRRMIQFADEAPVEAPAREHQVSLAQGVSDGSSGGVEAGPSSSQKALEALTKAVRVADDGIQVLSNTGIKQSNLQTSAGALKSWRLVELGTYSALIQLYTKLAADAPPGTEGHCVVCSEADKAQVVHAIDKRASCAEKKLQKKKNDVFEEQQAKATEVAKRLAQAEAQVARRCNAKLDKDAGWCSHINAIADTHKSEGIGEISGLRGLAGNMTSTENGALVAALQPHKDTLQQQRNPKNEQLRLMEAQATIEFTEPLFKLLENIPLMRRHAATMRELRSLDLHVDIMLENDVSRLTNSRPEDRKRSPVLTARERHVFLREERKQAIETGRSNSPADLSDITVYTPPTPISSDGTANTASVDELAAGSAGAATRLPNERWSAFYTRIARWERSHNVTVVEEEDQDTGARALIEATNVLERRNAARLRSSKTHGRRPERQRGGNKSVLALHHRSLVELRKLCAAQDTDSLVVGGPPVISKLRHRCSTADFPINWRSVMGESELQLVGPVAPTAIALQAAERRKETGVRILKYANQALRREFRNLKDVSTRGCKLDELRREVQLLSARLRFLRLLLEVDRCRRLVHLAGARASELTSECQKAECCAEYCQHLDLLGTDVQLALEQRRLSRKADKAEAEALKLSKHARFLEGKLAEDIQQTINSSTGGGRGQECPICRLRVEDGLLTPCGHFYCTDCTDRLLSENNSSCAICRKRLNRRTLFRVSAFAAATASQHIDADGDSGGVMRTRMRGDFGTKVNALVRWLLYQNEQQRLAHGGAGTSSDASKMVHEELGEEPDDKPPKALVFSQWITELTLVSKALAMNGIQYVELKGTLAARSQALHRFSTDPDVRVFLLCTGVANAGLTLVAATSVFILEPSLNPAIEEQAINRVHRIGQTRRTTCFRFVVRNSVEETILDLQEQKRASIMARPSDTTGGGFREISEEEAAALHSWEKEEGEQQVMTQLLDKIVSPRKHRTSDGHAEEEPDVVVADPRDSRFGDSSM